MGAAILLASCSSSKQAVTTPTPTPPAPPASVPEARPKGPLVAVARVYLDSASNVRAVLVDSQDVRA
ncbi:MAG TPA: hypothetical protein VFV24_09540, partial [Candidatus Eisenbacteria bacterium]|nr:hypothetical protein [Candidatus Eisenbacteria bacterium]